jgi:hypothetical protein
VAGYLEPLVQQTPWNGVEEAHAMLIAKRIYGQVAEDG